MKINNISIKNFKSYYGSNNHYDLTVDKDKNVILIIADSGFGKTTLMQAINWVLYDQEFLDRINLGRGNNKVTLETWINSSYKEEVIRNNGYGEIEVEMHFDHIETKYQITNKHVFYFDKNEKIQFESHSHTLKKLATNSSQWTTVNTLESEINKILPKNIVQYFFFDAEKQSKLTEPSNQKLVKEAIYNVIGLRNLEEARSNLKQISRDFNRQLSALPLGAHQRKQQRVVELEELLEEDEKELENLENEITGANNFIEEIENKLGGLPDSSSIQEKIENLKNEKVKLVSEKERVEIDLAKSNFKIAPTLIENELRTLRTRLDALKDEGKIPGTINTQLIDEVLGVMKCICGTDLNENPKERVHLEKLKDEISKQSSANYKLLDIFHLLGKYLDTFDFTQNRLNHQKLISGIDSIEEGIVFLENKIKEESNKLGDLDNEEVKGLKRQKDKLDEKLKSYIEQKGSLGQKIDSNKIELEKLVEELKGLELKDKQAKKLGQMIKMSRDVEKELTEIFSSFAEQTKTFISETTETHWNRLIDTTRRLNFSIDESFRFNVTNNYGANAINDLSEGQKQGLVLAFVSAISLASDTYPPYIIDMPFGRLGEKSQAEVARLIPSSSRQLILLLNKSSEFNEVTKQYLKPKSKRIYELTFDSDNRRTIIN